MGYVRYISFVRCIVFDNIISLTNIAMNMIYCTIITITIIDLIFDIIININSIIVPLI